jgi:hypothetical protein
MTTLAGLVVLVALAAAAAPAPNYGRVKASCTPQEVFNAAERARQKGDFKAYLDCLSPQTQRAMAAGLALPCVRVRAPWKRLKGSEDREFQALAERYASLFRLLDKHGLTEEASKAALEARTDGEARKALAALIEDPEAFLVELSAHEVLAGEVKGVLQETKSVAKLTGVKIDGDKAVGVIVHNGVIINFVKINGSWRIIPPLGLDEDKDEKKDK